MEDIADGSSSAVWDFGSALQYRVALEKRISEALSVGALYGYSEVPLRWRSGGPTPVARCSGSTTSCDASVDHTTIALLVSSGGTMGFHQVINIGVGAVLYNNFREDATGATLPPSGTDKDFFFALGYGIGVGFSRRFSASIIQDYGIVIHQRSGLQGNVDAYQNLLSFRLNLRVGLGG
jgi:hypothetical protein